MSDQLRGDPTVMERYLADLNRVALVGGESEEELSFFSAASVCKSLWKICEKWHHDKSVYFDV